MTPSPLETEAAGETTGRAAAPPPLTVVQAFVNTLDVETGEDAVPDPASLTTWLAERGLLSQDDAPALTGDEHRTLTELRETLRRHLRANHDRTGPPAGDLAELNRIAGRTSVRLHFREDATWELVPSGDGATYALGRILGAVAAAMADGTWSRLKVCAEDACQWAFYDTSRNRAGKWCSMAICGNRAKVRAYRRRQEEEEGG